MCLTATRCRRKATRRISKWTNHKFLETTQTGAVKIDAFTSLYVSAKIGSSPLSPQLLKIFYDTILYINVRWRVLCSLAVLDRRVGHTMDVLSPFISVLCHSDWLFHGESCPRILMLSIQAVRGLPRLRAPGIVPCINSFSRTATPLFPHGVTIVC